MKTFQAILIVLLFSFFCVNASGVDSDKHSKFSFFEDIELEIDDDGTIILTDKDYGDGTVEITRNYELYVNGERIETSDRQKEMLEEYYENINRLIVYAKRIGIEGAKIGVEGAKVGAKAIVGVLKMIFTDYDEDDLEDDIEDDAEEIEEMAEKLEKEADGLELLADDLEDLHHDLKDEFPELRELGWF